MARGQYVKTFAGAVNQGAATTVLNALAAGTSPGEALRARFPSIPGNVLGALVTNLSRPGSVFVERAAARDAARAAAVPSSAVTTVPGLPVRAEYTVIIYFAGPDGEEMELPVVVTNLPPGASEAAILAEANNAGALVLSGRTIITSPKTAAAREAIAELPGPPKPTRPPQIVRIRIGG